MTTEVNSIVIPWHFVELCEGWAGGEDSMLRAISSTDNLTTGTHRPHYFETDAEWYADLYSSLWCELHHITKRLKETHEDYYTLCEFRDWAEEMSERLDSELENDLDLEVV